MMKRMMIFLKKWFGEKNVSVVEKPMVESEKQKAPIKAETSPRKSSLLDDLEAYMFGKYVLRNSIWGWTA